MNDNRFMGTAIDLINAGAGGLAELSEGKLVSNQHNQFKLDFAQAQILAGIGYAMLGYVDGEVTAAVEQSIHQVMEQMIDGSQKGM